MLSITDNLSGALAVKRGEELGKEVVSAEGSGGRAGQGERVRRRLVKGKGKGGEVGW